MIQKTAIAIKDVLDNILIAVGGTVSRENKVGRKTVSTPGTAEALATTTIAKQVTATALLDNTDVVVIGGSGVIAALLTMEGTPLYPGDTCTMLCDDLDEVFVDVIVGGEGVTYGYIV